MQEQPRDFFSLLRLSADLLQKSIQFLLIIDLIHNCLIFTLSRFSPPLTETFLNFRELQSAVSVKTGMSETAVSAARHIQTAALLKFSLHTGKDQQLGDAFSLLYDPLRT